MPTENIDVTQIKQSLECFTIFALIFILRRCLCLKCEECLAVTVVAAMLPVNGSKQTTNNFI